MLILTNAGTDKLQLVTDAAVTVDVHATWIDRHTSTSAQTLGRTNTAITTAATTDIVATPGSSLVRIVKTLHIRNKHATTSVKVTVLYDQNGTDFELHSATLLAGESLEYVEGIGWFLLEAPDVTNPVTVARLGADQANSTITPTEVTGLTVLTGTGTYVFEYFLITQSAAATTGQRFDVNHDGTVTSFVWNQRYVDTSATAATAVPDQDAVGAAAHVMGAFASRAKGTAGRGTTLSVDTANADMFVLIEGVAIVTVAGNLELWHGSEVAAASTVKAGSSLRLTKTA
jgi:hypothetical protein